VTDHIFIGSTPATINAISTMDVGGTVAGLDVLARARLHTNGCGLGDIDEDGDVDLQDLAILLAHFGTASGAHWADGDLEGDGDVELQDLAILLANFGSTCA
jgi:hypothetical protein